MPAWTTVAGKPWKAGAVLAAPVLASLLPTSIAHGSPVLVTAKGTGFLPGSRIYVDGAAQITTYVDATTLRYNAQATSAGTQSVTVRTGSKTSAPQTLTVT